MGIVVVSLSTAYAFSEFFGLSGSLNTSFAQSKTFYVIFIGQLVVAAAVIMFPSINLFQLVIITQSINAMALPLVFYFLIRLANNRELMKTYVNNVFQKYFSITATVVIIIASVFTVIATLFSF
jgi:Mn2+/Fe2+ NRAMP family transporter